MKDLVCVQCTRRIVGPWGRINKQVPTFYLPKQGNDAVTIRGVVLDMLDHVNVDSISLWDCDTYTPIDIPKR